MQASKTIQETEERTSGVDNIRQEVNTAVKENDKFNIFQTQNIQEIWNTIKVKEEEKKKIQDKGSGNILNKVIEEHFHR